MFNFLILSLDSRRCSEIAAILNVFDADCG